MVAASFVACLVAFLLVGIASVARSRGTTADYYLASRAVHPALVGLSAVATNNSGYMFIGVIGFTYATGLPAIWLMFGWILGDWLASLAVHRPLRLAAERTGEVTYAGVLAHWWGANGAAVQRVAAVLTVVFLGTYAAAQLSAGGKALHSLFGWSVRDGAMLVAGIVAVYCLAGGIRASIWTDAVQAVVMLFAMGLLVASAVASLGGAAASVSRLAEVPGFLAWFPSDLVLPGVPGMTLFVVGWLFAGLSVIGQPHVMIRFMALDDPDRLGLARAWYYGFFTVFYALATAAGLLARVHVPELGALDPELALPTMAQRLLPPVWVGVILAGIFAATMSTADSLILACSAALTHDLPRRPVTSPWSCRAATLAVTGLALAIAVEGARSVFSLVILSWSTLASAFAPLLIVQALGGRPGRRAALAMMAGGTATALAWRAAGLHENLYEGMPGILAGIAVYAVAGFVPDRSRRWRDGPIRASTSEVGATTNRRSGSGGTP